MSYFRSIGQSRYSSLSETDLETDGSEKITRRGSGSRELCVTAWFFGILVVLQFIALYLVHLEAIAIRSNSQRLTSPIPESPKPHRGYINIPEYEVYGLKEGAIDNGKVMYGVSMFHQLDCLATIRKMVWDLAYKRLDSEELLRVTPNDTASNFDGGLHHGFWHVQHCLDYLRQALQCQGDLALEWPIEAGGKRLFVGWETLHQCRSYDAAWAYVDMHF